MIQKNIGKVLILTAILTILLRISTQFFSSQSEILGELQSGKSKEIFGNIWVAVTTNIGTRYKERNQKSEKISDTVIEIEALTGNENTINDTLLRANMLYIQEYYNLMKTDMGSVLSDTANRKETLEILISQLELRYKNGAKNLQTTTAQVKNLQTKISQIDEEVKTLKTKMNADFKVADTTATLQDKDEYLRLKADWNEALIYAFYFNQFIKQYNFLANYNKQILDTLINNKDVISKNSFVVLPDTGDGILKDLNLLMDEAEYKSTLKKDGE